MKNETDPEKKNILREHLKELKRNFIFKNTAEIKPQYIFEKITDLKTQCQQYDVSNCANYIKAGYFPTESDCKTQLSDYSKKCLDEKQYLKIGNICISKCTFIYLYCCSNSKIQKDSKPHSWR